MSQSQLQESHTNKPKERQTFLETLGRKLERLGNKAEATTNKTKQNRVQLRLTGSSVNKVGSSKMRLRLTRTHYWIIQRLPDHPP
jgi:hypothetical protein